ncbi:lipid A deacylase LpxR family protein [Marinospirillum sp.]|uniref:lipid A deacylase LpxR family protein n=1 Tax=Marinospirillum sp. TaxID=2183934 RepID=UPI002870421B|nr:lipid A deacylase LpxR family protein [Marinospirillum sp.]MDR9467916.1 lipid A deacylase LpxR family protein [Marinospirillum sp.]
MKQNRLSCNPILLLTVLLLLVVWMSPTQAQGYISLQIENDGVLGVDRHYTHGMQLNFMPEAEPPAWATALLPQATGSLASELSLGQAIFTPADIEKAAAQPQDRPWAGYLYASYALMSKPTERTSSFQEGQMLQLTLGHVGPDSGAELAQKQIHKLIGSPDPEGWEHQLGNEPTFNLHYFHKWIQYLDASEGRDLEVSPVFSLAAGSPYTYLSGSLALRWGDNLKLDYGPPALHPGYPGSSYFSPGTPWNWYVFGGLEYRRVIYNLFLDGNLFRSSPSVEKRADVGAAFAGAALIYRRARISFTTTYRTREFVGQEEGDFFGALNLSLKL